MRRSCRNYAHQHKSLLARPPGDEGSAGQLQRAIKMDHREAFDRLLELAKESGHEGEYTLAWLPGDGSALEVVSD